MIIRLRDKVVVLNADVVDPTYGSGVRDWTSATATPEPAEVRPVMSDEISLNESTVVSRWRIKLRPDTAATSASRVVHRGSTFEVDGDVQAVPDRRARILYCVAHLRRVTS